MTTYKHGFDLTLFKDGGFQTVLRTLRIPQTAKKQKQHQGWLWNNDRIAIVTYNNPITGEYYTGERQAEVNYASYMGLESRDQKLLQDAVASIRWRARYIKGESRGEREFI